MKGKSTAGITSPGPGSEITSQELTSGMNFPILQLQELHRSHVFPDVDHPSKALSNVFPEKRQGGIFAGLHMPACRFSSPLPAAASTGVSRDNGRVNRERPDITDLGNDDRRLSRRFYSPILLFESYAVNLRLCVPRRDLGPPPSAMCPWTPGSGVRAVHRPWQNDHGRARTSPRTGAKKATDGAGRSSYADRPRPDSPSDLAFQDACSVSSSPSSPGSCPSSRVPRASAMRWLAAVAWPSMQCA